MSKIQTAWKDGIFRCSNDGQTIFQKKGQRIPLCSCGKGRWQWKEEDNDTQDVLIIATAEIWGTGMGSEKKEVCICKKGEKITVDAKAVEMTYNSIQLRFEIPPENIIVFIIFNRNNPDHSIAEMYEELGGKISVKR